jgi:hypothetical protein
MGDDMIRADSPDPRDVTQRPRPPEAGRRPLDEDDSLPKLGSLAQEARNKHLRQARNTLLGVGILWAVVQVIFFFVEMGEVQKAGPQVDPTVGTAIVVLFHGVAVAVALFLIVCALFVERYPVPITVTALVVFVVVQGGFALLDAAFDPANLLRGIILKIIVIVVLVRALRAGLAAQREQREAEAAAEYGG